LKTEKSNLENLIAISKHIGMNLDLVQGPGGNISVKEDKVLWVKASGCSLKDAGNSDIFVPVDYSKIITQLTKCEYESVAPETLTFRDGTILRPSIETSLHALMPHRFVIHVHSVSAIANVVLDDGKKIVTRLLNGIDWAWIPYVRPGLPLTRAVQNVMRSGLNVLVLGNHGLVLGADSMDEVFELLDELENRLYRLRREPSKLDKKELKTLLRQTDYLPSKFSLVHSLAFDPIALSIVTKNPIYPDHIVFLGPGPMLIMTGDDLLDYLNRGGRDPEYKVIIVKDIGVIKHHSLSESAEEMLHCLANVLLRIQAGEKLRHLTDQEEAEITGWDAEKFRRSKQK
jgi:rhamnose utilization protein RhaD (predicted bifunctional aldolase and dehydrogenase)